MEFLKNWSWAMRTRTESLGPSDPVPDRNSRDCGKEERAVGGYSCSGIPRFYNFYGFLRKVPDQKRWEATEPKKGLPLRTLLLCDYTTTCNDKGEGERSLKAPQSSLGLEFVTACLPYSSLFLFIACPPNTVAYFTYLFIGFPPHLINT